MSTPTAEQTAMFWDAPRVPTPTPRETRNAAYYALERLGEKQRSVLLVVRQRGPVSDKQIAAVLGWPINRVTPRRGELAALGLLTQAGTHLDPTTQRHVATWRATGSREGDAAPRRYDAGRDE